MGHRATESSGLSTTPPRGYRRAEVYAATDWADFAGVDWLDRIMHETVTDRLHEKQGRAIARWTLTAADGRKRVVYLKRHFVLPSKDSRRARWFPGRAWSPGWQEFHHLRWAESVGLPVPRVSAAAELITNEGKLQSFIALDELTGMLGLHEAVPLAYERLPAEQFARWKRGLIRELARLSRELHRRRRFHKDLYFCHFYIAESDTQTVPDDWHGRMVMIDLHRLSQHRLGWQWYLVKDLGQLLYSSDVPGVSARDRVRFWREYCREGWGDVSAPGGWLAHWIRRKSGLYRRNHERREAKAARAA